MPQDVVLMPPEVVLMPQDLTPPVLMPQDRVLMPPVLVLMQHHILPTSVPTGLLAALQLDHPPRPLPPLPPLHPLAVLKLPVMNFPCPFSPFPPLEYPNSPARILRAVACDPLVQRSPALMLWPLDQVLMSQDLMQQGLVLMPPDLREYPNSPAGILRAVACDP